MTTFCENDRYEQSNKVAKPILLQMKSEVETRLRNYKNIFHAKV
jgi:hypothetical protein